MTQSTSAKNMIGKDTAFFLVMLAVSVCASALGYWIADFCFDGVSAFTFASVNLYADCHLQIEYIARCALLCRPLLIDAAFLLLLANSRFEYPLSSLYFLLRGIAFGTALYVSLHAVGASALVYLPIAYISITLMYLIYSRMLHTRCGPCSRSDALVFAMIAAGASSLVFAAVSVSFL